MMKKNRVLLADDHAVVRAGIRNAIEDLDDLVVAGEASDGPTVNSSLAKLQPDLLIIDVTMPDFDPIPEIRNFKSIYPDMKILVISAYDDDVYVQGLLQAGVNGYHLKDQSLKDLRLAVQRVINGEKWISGALVDKLLSFQNSSPNNTVLSMRQRDILKLLQKGRSNQAIALDLNLSVKTIENHLTRIYRVIGVQSRVEAVNYLAENPDILSSSPDHRLQFTEKTLGTENTTLLLVDDNPLYRQQLNRIIASLSSNTTVVEAGTIEEAVSIVRTTDPDLVFVDVLLGEQNGIQCAEQILAISPKTRIILISAYPDEEFRRQSMIVGAAAFIDKKVLDSASLKQILADISL